MGCAESRSPSSPSIKVATGTLVGLILCAGLLATPPVHSQSGTDASQGARDGAQAWSPFARLLTEAEALVRASQFRPAYRLLQPKAELYAGDVEFDFLLGLSALESGRPAEAVQALERVLSSQPDNPRARAELARARVVLEDQEKARQEFESLASQQLPDETKAIVGRYLNAITRVRDQPDPVVEGELTIGLGWDDNINVDSGLHSWVLRDGMRLVPASTEPHARSAQFSLAGELRTTVPINGRVQWMTGINGSGSAYPSADPLNHHRVDLFTGFAYRNQCHQLKVLGQAQAMRVDDASFRNAYGLVGQWQCDIDASRQLGGFIQRFEFRYPGSGEQDAARQSVGISFAQMLSATGRPVLLASLLTGREFASNTRPEASYDFSGLRLMLIAPINGGLRGLLSVHAEQRRYDGLSALSGLSREDIESALTLSVQCDVAERWTLEPRLVLSRNQSTLAGSEFRRTEAQLMARYHIQ